VSGNRSPNSLAMMLQATTKIATRLGNRQIRSWKWRVLAAIAQGGGGLWMASRTKDPMVRAGSAGMVLGAVDTLASL